MSMDRRRFIHLATGTVSLGGLRGLPHAIPWSRASAGKQTLNIHDYVSQRRYVTTDFGRIAYIDHGRGKVVLFLHGFPLNNYQWRGVIGRVAHGRRCIAPDMLGMGHTEVKKEQSVTPDAQVAMLVTLLDRLAIKEVDVVANDSGGAVAQLLLARHPECVGSMLLTNCDTEPDSPPPALLPVIELARAGRFADEQLAPWLADKALARSAKGLGGIAFTHPDQLADETIDYYLGPLVRDRDRKVLTNAYAVGLAPNPLAGIEASLKRSHVSVRIVWGTGDNIFSQASPDYLDRTVGNPRGVRRVPGAKLFFPEEFPDVIAEEVMKLIHA